jgi:hypothetical protein
MPLHPKTNATFTQLKQQSIGVAVNGVPLVAGQAVRERLPVEITLSGGAMTLQVQPC